LVSIADPSAGTITYGYDGYGNRSMETDARGKTTNSTFDKFGKVINGLLQKPRFFIHIT